MMKKLRTKFNKLARANTPSGYEYRVSPYIIRSLMSNGFKVAFDSNYDVIGTNGKPGENLPLLCAHMDTVNRIKTKVTLPLVYNSRRQVIHTSGSKYVLGGDDKCGIAIILELVENAQKNNHKFKVLFTCGEEAHKGARLTNPRVFDDVRYCIVLDRRGSSDVVVNIANSDLCSEQYAKWIGTMAPEEIMPKFISSAHSDAAPISKYTNSVNLSCGYYEPHKPDEYVRLQDMLNTYNWVKNCLDNPFEDFEAWMDSLDGEEEPETKEEIIPDKTIA